MTIINYNDTLFCLKEMFGLTRWLRDPGRTLLLQSNTSKRIMRISKLLNWCLFLVCQERSCTGMNTCYYQTINLTKTCRYDRFPDFCGGLAYFITKAAVVNIVKSYSEGNDYLWLDDVFITGILSKKAGVHLIDWKVFQVSKLYIKREAVEVEEVETNFETFV